MSDHAGSRKPAKCAPPRNRNILALLGEAFDVGLVDNGVLPGDSGSALLSPGERLVHYDAFGHAAGIVSAVERQVGACAAGAVTEMSIAPGQTPADPFGIGIDQKLVRIEAKAALRLIRAVDPIAVELPRRHVVEITVPDVFGALRQLDALDLATAVAVEQAKHHLFSIRRKQRKIRAPPIPAGAKRVRQTG